MWDITKAVTRRFRSTSRRYDDPTDLTQARGKQDWQLQPHSIWYPRTTGIWQTVWYEIVPASSIDFLRWTPNLERWELGLEVGVRGESDRLRLHVRLSFGELVIADDSYLVASNEVHRRIALSDPGIDDFRNELLWSPESPSLIDATLELRSPEGAVLDQVASYTALRSVTVKSPCRAFRAAIDARAAVGRSIGSVSLSRCARCCCDGGSVDR